MCAIHFSKLERGIFAFEFGNNHIGVNISYFPFNHFSKSCTHPEDTTGTVFIIVDITISSEEVIAEAETQDSYMEMEPSAEKDASNTSVTTPTSSKAEYMDMSPSTPQGRPYWKLGTAMLCVHSARDRHKNGLHMIECYWVQ